MHKNNILILGGYGNTGLPVARLLLQETGVNLVVAGRNLARAQAAAAALNRDWGERVQAGCADASDVGSLRRAMQDVDLVVVASSTSLFTRELAGTALQAGVDYLDVQYSTKKLNVLKSMAPAIEKAGLCFVTDGGFHPGLPAALVRYAATHFNRLETARVGSVIKIDWKGLDLGEATLDELLREFDDFQNLAFHDGRWQPVRWWGISDMITMDFGRPFGKQPGVPMLLEEMRVLPELFPSLKDAGFYVGSFNPFVDWVILPLVMVALRIAPTQALRPMGRLMRWGLNTFTRPPYGTLLKVEAKGQKDGQARTYAMTLSHPDGYMFTAIPVVATLLQYLDGSIRKPGLWMQANLVEPLRLMKDMQRMGVAVEAQEG